ncbi:MAG: TIGR00269 family protein [Nanoarchaeota archaeon]
MNFKQLEKKVSQTLKKAKIKKSDKILVALSGGKDSTLTAYLLHKLGYKIHGLYLNLHIGKYSQDCLKAVQDLCEQLKIPLYIYDIKKEIGSGICYLRTAVQNSNKGKGLKNCAICGVLKKWILNKEARKLKTKYIATGHNLDDESQTFLINILKGSPELSGNIGIISQNSKILEKRKFVPRIKPLFYIPEDLIKKYTKEKKLPVVYQSCPCALDSYRIQLRNLFKDLSNKEKLNIVKSFEYLNKKIQKTISTTKKPNICKICGEPARKEICKKCELLRNI